MPRISNINENNAFVKLQESANGRVSVKLQRNQFAKEGTESFYGRVERYTYSTRNILDIMTEAVPLVDLGTVTSVLNAYANTVRKVLASGNAVRFGELGTFYIAGKGTVESETEKPKLTVKFSAAPALKEAVQHVEITSAEYVPPSGVITGVTDIASGRTDGTLTAKGSVLVEGEKLKVGGEASGIWFAPVTESGRLSADESSWVKVSSRLVYNLPAKLLFALPPELAGGSYRIVVRTRYAGRAGYERKYLVEAVSDPVTVGGETFL